MSCCSCSVKLINTIDLNINNVNFNNLQLYSINNDCTSFLCILQEKNIIYKYSIIDKTTLKFDWGIVIGSINYKKISGVSNDWNYYMIDVFSFNKHIGIIICSINMDYEIYLQGSFGCFNNNNFVYNICNLSENGLLTLRKLNLKTNKKEYYYLKSCFKNLNNIYCDIFFDNLILYEKNVEDVLCYDIYIYNENNEECIKSFKEIYKHKISTQLHIMYICYEHIYNKELVLIFNYINYYNDSYMLNNNLFFTINKFKYSNVNELKISTDIILSLINKNYSIINQEYIKNVNEHFIVSNNIKYIMLYNNLNELLIYELIS